MKYIILLFVLSFLSCSGVLYDGIENRAIEDTMTITIIIEDPMWTAYVEWYEKYGEIED